MDDILNEYGTDTDREAEGVWSPDFRAGLEFKIRSPQSPQVKAANAKVTKRSERYWKVKEDVPEAVQHKNSLDVLSATVADWRVRAKAKTPGEPDVVSSAIPYNGRALECTDENKRLVFADKRLWPLRNDIIAQSNEIDRYRQRADEEDAGNSVAPSAPASSSTDTAAE